MYYAKASNCCFWVREVLNSGLDGGFCPPENDSAPCRGFTGECGDIQEQFWTVPVPGYPNGLQDWNCDAFPDDDLPLDTFLVGLSASLYHICCC